jgi:hypothetical protein
MQIYLAVEVRLEYCTKFISILFFDDDYIGLVIEFYLICVLKTVISGHSYCLGLPLHLFMRIDCFKFFP